MPKNRNHMPKNMHLEPFREVLEHHLSADGDLTTEGYRQLHVHAHRVLHAFVPTDQGLQDLERILLRLHELSETLGPEFASHLYMAIARMESAKTALSSLLQKMQAQPQSSSHETTS